MATRRALSASAALEIKRLANEVDERGRKRYSQMAIAKMLGVGETTVFRVLNGAGAYQALPDPKTEDEALESARRFREEHPELFTAEGKMVAAVTKEKEQVATVDKALSDLTDESLAKERGYLD